MIEKKYHAKIIANDQEGLTMISACMSGGRIKVSDMKYLPSNKIFLLSVERPNTENKGDGRKINSICRVDFVSNVRSKNINQKKKDRFLDFLAIETSQMADKNYEMNLIFSGE